MIKLSEQISIIDLDEEDGDEYYVVLYDKQIQLLVQSELKNPAKYFYKTNPLKCNENGCKQLIINGKIRYEYQ